MRPLLVVALALVAGCGAGQTRYPPVVVARGELVLQYSDGLEVDAGGRRVARGLGFSGLSDYVRCVPEAKRHADKASHSGRGALLFSTVGAIFGAASLGGLVGYGLSDNDTARISWLAGGVGVAIFGAIFAGMGRMMKNAANGHAVDAVDYYNDYVGSLGATCDDLRYPPPAGYGPPPPVAAPPAPPPPVAAPPAPPPADDGDDIQ